MQFFLDSEAAFDSPYRGRLFNALRADGAALLLDESQRFDLRYPIKCNREDDHDMLKPLNWCCVWRRSAPKVPNAVGERAILTSPREHAGNRKICPSATLYPRWHMLRIGCDMTASI
ncbi:hypothetical protein RB195_024878 [Necator americanus]|uniref:Uncharacterized protein n=1 Tax=Necator americanus TaxID=51031 RepID=A0ABR1EQ34_NECAM